MVNFAPERTDDLLISLRRGFDLDDLENPAGPLFGDSHREYEITMTGGGLTINHTWNPVTYFDENCMEHYCCMT
jgi:hypothetical protein